MEEPREQGPSDFVRQPEALRPQARAAPFATASMREPPTSGYVRQTRIAPAAIRTAGASAQSQQQPTEVVTAASIASVASTVLEALEPRDACLRVEPAAVHFSGGFGDEAGGTRALLRALVRVRNVAADAQRVYVMPIDAAVDDGRFFAVEVRNAGRIAPGMSQDFVVTFAPQNGALRYHYASVRVVGEWGEVLVPLHAYPVATAFRFPSRIDFGRVALLDVAQKRITLTAGVPIDFDFSLEVRLPHPDIIIEPTGGTISAGGSLDVLVSYAPSTLSTALCEVFVHAAQHNWKPFKCVIAGSSHPGQRRDRQVAETLLASAAAGSSLQRQQQGQDNFDGTSMFTGAGAADESKEGKDGGSGGEHEWAALAATSQQPGGSTQSQGPGQPHSTGMKRWTKRDPGLGLLDDKLTRYKESAELRLVSALETRRVVVDALAAAMHVATGADFSREEADELIKATVGADAAVDDFGSAEAASLGNFQVIGGVRIPAKPRLALSDVNFVLNQKPGQLLPSDIKRAVKAKRLQAAATDAAKARMQSLSRRAASGPGEGASALPESARGRSGGGADGLTVRSASRGSRAGSPRAVASEHVLVRRSRGASQSDPADRAAVQADRRRDHPAAGPGLPSAALAAAELAASWLFPALQGARASELPRLLATLVATPDHGYVATASLLDDVLGTAGAVVLGSGQRNGYMERDFTAGLPPALAAIVRASASPLLDPRLLRESVFVQETGEIAQAEAHRETSNFAWEGERLVSARTVARVRRLRALLAAFQDVVTRRLLRTRRATLAIPAGGLAAMTALQAAAGAAAVAAAAAQTAEREDARLAAVLHAGGHGGGLLGDAARRKAAEAVEAAALATAAAQEAARIAGSNPILSSPVVRAALLPLSRAIVPGGLPAARAPTFVDASGRDAWALRSDAMSRLRRAVSTRVARTRVDKRLALLQAKIAGAAAAARVDMRGLAFGHSGVGTGAGGGAGGVDTRTARALEATRVAVAAVVDREHRRAQIEGAATWVLLRPSRTELAVAIATGAATGTAEERERLLFSIRGDRIQRSAFAVAPVGDDADADAGTPAPAPGAAGAEAPAASAAWDRAAPLPCAVPSWFCEAAPFEEAEWPEGEATGYTPLPLPCAPLYQPLEADRALREGALHESAATGLLPLACAQSATDARLDFALRTARAPAPRGGFALGAEALLLRAAWAELAQPPPCVRSLPASAPHTLSADPATGLTEAGATEADAAYLLHPYQALLEPFSAAAADMPAEVTGLRHAHAAGMGLGLPPPRVAGLLNAGMTGFGGSTAAASGASSAAAAAAAATLPAAASSASLLSAASASAASASALSLSDAAATAAAGGASPLDANGALPTAGQIYGSQLGFSSLRAFQAPAGLFGPGVGSASSSSSAPPPPLFFAHAFTPSVSRPPLDLGLPLMRELPQPALPPGADGTPARRLPTDVTAPERRLYSALLLPPTRDPWVPTLLTAHLPTLQGPRDEDVLSDDSESDPDLEEAQQAQQGGGEVQLLVQSATGFSSPGEGSDDDESPDRTRHHRGGGGAGGYGGSHGGGGMGPGSRRSGPTMEKARALFLPRSMLLRPTAPGAAAPAAAAAAGTPPRSSSASVARPAAASVAAGGASLAGGAGSVHFAGAVPGAEVAPAAAPVLGRTAVALQSMGFEGGPAPREGAARALAGSAAADAAAATGWLAAASVSARGANVNAGLSEPRRRLVLSPE